MIKAHRKRYAQVIQHLIETRKTIGLSREILAERLGVSLEFVADVEGLSHMIDVVVFYDWVTALGVPIQEVLEDLGWMDKVMVAPDHIYPMHGNATEEDDGIILSMKYQGGVSQVFLSGLTVEKYLDVEAELEKTYKSLNENKNTKNRDAIHSALVYATTNLPNVNPSDVYQHIVYRIYLREYKKSDPEQSWRRAGGEAMELFVQSQYNQKMIPQGVMVVALISGEQKKKALAEMGLSEKVGGSKLDVALYGNINNNWIIFGGVHCKASLAERVSDDVPASTAMMGKGLLSILYTFDSKSFPPPSGDLVNRGELGTPDSPSDKRKYIEEHGAFDACFCYNTRSHESGVVTSSGKRVYVSDLQEENDKFPEYVLAKWNEYKAKLAK